MTVQNGDLPRYYRQIIRSNRALVLINDALVGYDEFNSGEVIVLLR